MGNVIKKVVIGLIVGGALFGITRALEFPTVFQWMFFAYALLGTAVFILLDAPPVKPVGGVKALGALVVFYIVLCVVYIAGASLWPRVVQPAHPTTPADAMAVIPEAMEP